MLDKNKHARMLAHCGELHEDDLIDPRDFHQKKSQPPKRMKKAFQVARQVFETLQLVLHDTDDEILDAVSITKVEPAPDSRRMSVMVEVDKIDDVEISRDLVLACLESQKGRLRTEIARSINRRKTPQLVFAVYLKKS